eukprot:531365-Pelagomonas_calceolata.AAC.5
MHGGIALQKFEVVQHFAAAAAAAAAAASMLTVHAGTQGVASPLYFLLLAVCIQGCQDVFLGCRLRDAT